MPIAIIAVVGGYLMRNPDKARTLNDRISGAFGATTTRLNNQNPSAGNGFPPPSYPPSPPGQQAGYPPVPPAIGTPPPSAGLNALVQHQHATPHAPAAPAPATQKPAMRFNQPPGWMVPSADWLPDSDWRPNPAWPPAPAGWQFWVPAQPNVIEAPTQRFSAGTTYS